MITRELLEARIKDHKKAIGELPTVEIKQFVKQDKNVALEQFLKQQKVEQMKNLHEGAVLELEALLETLK